MSFLPIMLNLENKKILVIGGGKIATRKILYLLNFTNNITVVSTETTEELNNLVNNNNIKITHLSYKKENLTGFDMVICAINDLKLQKDIYFHCKQKNILYSCVDFKEYCDFIFPSLIKQEELIITVSTQGIAPSVSKELATFIKKLLPKNLNNFLKEMKELRNSLPKGEKRMALLKKRAKEFFKD